MSAPLDTCLYCGARQNLWRVIDEPENDCALLFGDEAVARVLCEPCLEASERDGPWAAVARLEVGAPPGARRRRSNAGKPIRMGEETLRRARELYGSGLSIRAVARELHPDTAYATPASLAASLYEQFRLRGWTLRDQRAVTAARNHRHGLATRDGDRAAYRRHWRRGRSKPCAGVKTQPPGVGKPCSRRAMKDSDYCIAHDPARAEWRDEHLAELRARIGGRRPAA